MFKKVLILGGTGYIGSGLYLYLTQNGYEVDTVDLEWFRNFSNPNNIKKDFVDLEFDFLTQYDTVILVAGHSSVPLCLDVLGAVNNNVYKVIRLIEKLQGTSIKFIYASSSCVYVNSETPATEDSSTSPVDGLTLTKIMLDEMLPLIDGVRYYGLRFGSVNGWAPNLRTDLMINAMTLSGLHTGSVNVFNGKAYRPILSMNDLCRAVRAIIDIDVEFDHKDGIYNLAGFNSTIENIGISVAGVLGCEVDIHQDENINTYNFLIDSTKFKKTFNFEFEDTDIDPIVQSLLTHVPKQIWKFNPIWKPRKKECIATHY